MDWGAIDRYAKSLIKEAGHRIRVSFAGKIQIETKADANDLVTDIDRDIEQFFISRIRRDFPGHRILGEEGFGDDVRSGEGVVWILDPIDGTMNFIHQQRNFAISLGIYADGVGMLGYIYDVMADDFYHAYRGEGAYRNDERLPRLAPVPIEKAIIGVNASWVTLNRYIEHEAIGQLVSDCRGTRSYGSAAIELAHVAAGRLDAYISMRLAPWDVAGGSVIISEVGAVATNLRGEQLDMISKDTFIAARPGLHQTVLDQYIRLKRTK
ncbi:inositol monophosphatase family protein [Bhargavaea ginsengi]|uniref:inositol monophosphatase family protein n=1 Tax=Bhargavaea ginsengi TaxID=426757 RepID=UPI003C718567